MKGFLGRLRRSTLAGNAAVLYGAHLVGLLVPLVTIPYLARVLRPEGWGLVVFAQSFAAWTALVVEYGFDLSGTREVARAREGDRRMADVVAGVQGAKVVTTLVAGSLALGAFLLVPFFRDHPLLFACAATFAVLKGFSPFWYFQGLERMKGATLLDAGTRAMAALGVFVVVTRPGHDWRVLALQAGGAGISLVVMSAWMYHDVALRMPSPTEAWRTLKRAAGVFVFRSSSGLYMQANAFILGLLSTARVVGFFGGAEKIVRAAVNLLNPLTQALYPRLSHLVVADPPRARRLFRICVFVMLGLGSAMGVVAFAGAPLLVGLLLGPGYEEAVPVLRILALLPPIIAVGGVLGLYWALPFGLEKPFYRLVLLAGLVNVGLALLLVTRFGAVGMAVSVVVAELLVSSGLVKLYVRRGAELWEAGATEPTRSVEG